jgi:hypothetical protein
VPDNIRSAMARLLRRGAPRLQVLAHSEIPETHLIRIGPILGGARIMNIQRFHCSNRRVKPWPRPVLHSATAP